MDIKHYYIEKGQGFPLILLHGNGEDHSYFEHQRAFFSDYFRVIAIDTRGHGLTERGKRPFTIAQFAEDLHDFMLFHSIEKAHILGFSDGANIAMKFAMRYPEMVSSLVLNGGNLHPSGVKRSVQLPIELGYKIANFFAKKSPAAKKNAEMLGLMVNDPFIKDSELKSITARTLVVSGTRDMILKEHTEHIAASIPGAKLCFINGDHFVANKNPDEFNLAIDAFLRE